MAKYINADKLIEALEKQMDKIKDNTNFAYTMRAIDNMQMLVERLPTENVEEVIHCKDCKYWEYKCQGDFNFIYGNCLYWEIENYSDYPMETTGEHYCSFAERRKSK